MSDLNREEIAKNWVTRSFSCNLWIDAPGQRWEDFTHETDEVVIVLGGNMEFEIEGKLYHPNVGEELFIPARAVHSARNIGEITARWLYGYKRT